MISLKNVSAGYNGHDILKNISLDIPEQSVIALTGPSGCGKTTLLRVLGELLPPRNGQIMGVRGRRISFLFQEDRLLPWCTALENVLIAMDAPEPWRAIETLDILGINEPRKYPHCFSGGMQRRVALARALCFAGDLMLLDEPFKGLDNELRDQIAPFILSSASTIVMATHDRDDIGRMHAHELSLPDLMKT